MTNRPGWLVVVLGTGTEVGKTWVGCGVATTARHRGLRVVARKPAQSFDPDPPPGSTDAEHLATATGDDPERVCPPHRWYPVAMAPPMAADVLHRPPIRLADLLDELAWPADVDVGVVETAGGVRSPLAHDADSAEAAHALEPDLALLVADAGLGTINAVRLALPVLAPLPVLVLLNRFDHHDDLHRRNRAWLERHETTAVAVDPRAVPISPAPR